MDQTAICNLALANIGSTNLISSIDENVNEARVLKAQWDAAVLRVLEAHPWTFATVRRALSESGTAALGWGFAYALPANCVRPLSIEDGLKTRLPSQAYKYLIESDPDPEAKRSLLYADVEDAVLVYVDKVLETGRWSQHFIDALAALLAMRIAPAFAKKRETFVDAVNMYRAALAEAQAYDSNICPENPPDTTPSIMARGTSITPSQPTRS